MSDVAMLFAELQNTLKQFENVIVQQDAALALLTDLTYSGKKIDQYVEMKIAEALENVPEKQMMNLLLPESKCRCWIDTHISYDTCLIGAKNASACPEAKKYNKKEDCPYWAKTDPTKTTRGGK